MKRATFIALVFMIAIRTALPQENIILIDTTDYLPLPDGLNINLSIAASKGYPGEIFRIVKLGADINSRDESGATPLIYAVANNNQSAVNTICTYKPELDTYTNLGETALHISTKNNFLEISEILIRRGADINIKDNYRCTPLHYSALFGYPYLTDLLIYYNADLNAVSADGTTPLMAAVWAGYADIADMLIQAGADISIKDKRGFTALLIAAQNSDTLITRLLLDAGSSLSEINEYGYDIASITARTGSEEYLEFLLNSTEWKIEQNREAIDPMKVARKYGRTDIYKIFRNNSIGQNNSRELFDQAQISLNTSFFAYDVYLGGKVSFIEPLHKIRINAEFQFKPMYTRVLQKESDNLYYQYSDKRYVLSSGIGKEFVISENYFKGWASIVVNLNIGYMMASKYKGTYITPPSRFLVIPDFAIERSYGNFSVSFGYQYMRTGLYKAGPNWLKASMAYTFHFNKVTAPLKNIDWY